MRSALTLALFLLLTPAAQAVGPIGGMKSWLQCGWRYLTRAPSPEPFSDLPETHVESLEGLIEAFRKGALPSPGDPSHEIAFEIYRAMKLGQASHHIPADAMKRILKILRKYPGLRKEPFRSIEVNLGRKEFERIAELDALARKLAEEKRATMNLLFKLQADIPAWKKVAPFITKKELAGLFDKELTDLLRTDKTDALVTHGLLYQRLVALKEKKQAEGADVAPLSHLILSLVNSFGLHNPKIEAKLGSRNGLVVLDGLRELENARSNLAEHLGFSLGYRELLEKTQISPTRDFFEGESYARKLLELEEEVLKKPLQGKDAQTKRLVRQLSLYESPFRSCLGQDCSSGTYFGRALDPNYHYFTITNPHTGESDGHVTVVLGEAKGPRGRVKVAFVDKIQNISNTDLAYMLEAIRISVAEKGYELSIPTKMGEHNGISNQAATSLYVEKSLKSFTKQDKVYTQFSSHPHRYGHLENEEGFSRADDKLSVKPLLALANSKDIQFSAGEMPVPSKLASLNLDELRRKTLDLKRGDLNSKLQYLEAAPVLSLMKQGPDPEYHRLIEEWATDTALPISFRNKVISRALEDAAHSERDYPELGNLLRSFTPEQRRNLIQNWLQTPRYETKVMQDRKGIFFPFSVGHFDSMVKLIPERAKAEVGWSFAKLLWKDSSPEKREKLNESFGGNWSDGREAWAILDVRVKDHAREIARTQKRPLATFDDAVMAFMRDPEVDTHVKAELLGRYLESNPADAIRFLPQDEVLVELIAKGWGPIGSAFGGEGQRIDSLRPFLPFLKRGHFNRFLDWKNPDHRRQVLEILAETRDWFRDPHWTDLVLGSFWANAADSEWLVGVFNAIPNDHSLAVHGEILNYFNTGLSREEKLEVTRRLRTDNPEKVAQASLALLSGAPHDVAVKIRDQLLPHTQGASEELARELRNKLARQTYLKVHELSPVKIATPGLFQGALFSGGYVKTTLPKAGVWVTADRLASGSPGAQLHAEAGKYAELDLGPGRSLEEVQAVGGDSLLVRWKENSDPKALSRFHLYSVTKSPDGTPQTQFVREIYPRLKNPTTGLSANRGIRMHPWGENVLIEGPGQAKIYGKQGLVSQFALSKGEYLKQFHPTPSGNFFVVTGNEKTPSENQTFEVTPQGKRLSVRAGGKVLDWSFTKDGSTQLAIREGSRSDEGLVDFGGATAVWIRDRKIFAKSVLPSNKQIAYSAVAPDGTLFQILYGKGMIRTAPGGKSEVISVTTEDRRDWVRAPIVNSQSVVFFKDQNLHWYDQASRELHSQRLSFPIRDISEKPDGSVVVLMERGEVKNPGTENARLVVAESYTQVVQAPRALE